MRISYAKTAPGATPPHLTAGWRNLLTAAALCVLTGAPRADDTPAPAALLTGDAAWNQILGHTIAGTTPDGTYSEFFAPDGTLRLVDADGKAGGRWTWRDGRLCTAVDDDDEECRTLAVTGTTGAFTDEAGSRYPFDILPGNPKGL